MTLVRFSDDDLAYMCDEEGWPSVGENLAAGMTQEEATKYLIGQAPFYSDRQARYTQDYLAMLHGPSVRRYRYYA